jgi:hypothetical protein
MPRSYRQRRKAYLRRTMGNPWDSDSKSTSSKSPRSPRNITSKVSLHAPKKSSIKSRTHSNRVTFREPLERSASKSKSISTTSSRHSAWHSVSSK